jgi:cellulose synthase/poly-beta-1,6-N-acetylglucosamine synthase-like glycosyltransferase
VGKTVEYMLSAVIPLLAAVHYAALSGLCLYGLHRLWLIRCLYLDKGVEASTPPSFAPPETFPAVTVQLPLYNERFVAKRLLNAAASLDWPTARFEIQVLDDSDDDTCLLVDERVAWWQKQGIAITVVRRSSRDGYKAGALAHGLLTARGEFVAVFDADFIPPPDFLHNTIPWFRDHGVGMVQTRWGFCNADHSWFTGIQALLLGPHFSIEHRVRYRQGLFFNFNGTAGVWRRRAIDSAGGWRSDTVTEDLDLSYRAQLAGWRFVYREECRVPSELPVTMSALRGQQQRWAKGSIQTARKILPVLLRKRLPMAVKFEAMAHLLANIYWLLGMIAMLTLYPAVTWRVGIGLHHVLRIDLPLFLLSSVAIMGYFLIYSIRSGSKKLGHLFLLPALTIGLAPSISLSVLKGVFRQGGEFKRTPKFGVRGRERVPGMAFLYHQKNLPYIIINGVLFLYCLLPVIFAWQRETWFAVPLFLLFPFGFALVLAKDIGESVLSRPAN